ncbi:MAG: cell division protein FtsA [Candidatus Paceibacterota bacterium]
MIRNISVGIDIGTTTTRVVVGEFLKGETNPSIIGIGESPTEGLRHGYVISTTDAIRSLKKALTLAEKSSGIKIKRAFLSIGGVTLKGETSTGTTIVSKADNEVTHLDIEKALEDCEDNLNLGNKKVVQVFPIAYKLDGKEIVGRIEGNIGNKLEIKALFATCSNQHFEDLVSVVTGAGVEVIDIVVGIIATSNIALNKKQKIVGSLLVDLGSETTNIAIFENEALVALHTFSIGGTDITNDIALGLKITLEEAENIKMGKIPENISKKKVDEIVEARLSDVFELIENHLKKIKRNELLPGGVIWTGGGANTESIIELSKMILKLPSRIGTTEMFGTIKTKLKESSWFPAIGLLLVGKEKVYEEGSLALFFNDFKNTIKSALKQFMP